MSISDCIESLNLFISLVYDRPQGERDKITKLLDLKPSSFEFVLIETIELLEQVRRENNEKRGADNG